MFTLDERLAGDCLEIGHLPLSLVLLMKDANFPWLILVPRVDGAREIVDLDNFQRQQLLDESCVVLELLQQLFNPDKLNVAALGNVVAQLHVHHIARFKTDKAWPKPVWGSVSATPYTSENLLKIKQQLQSNLQNKSLIFQPA